MGMRDIHAHNYINVIDNIVWKALTDEIPYIKQYLENLL